MEQSDNVFWKGKLTICKEGHSTVRGSRSSLPVIEEQLPKSHHFAMGYFPSSCVKLFKAETDGYSPPFSRSFRTRSFMNRKAVWRMRPRILKPSFWTTPRNTKAVFGIDLTLHLIQTNTETPLVLTKCIAVIESHGLITGIYRQCGIQSNIARLRYEFDHGQIPDLTDSKILRDIHCVSSLLKTYFRQLPNPLFTYELYADILAAYESDPKDRIKNIRQTILRLPSAHYRTARALMYHLSRMCRHKDMTDMNASNLSIVWAPNLFRVPTTDEDADGQLLRGITIHKSLCNFFIVYAHVIFAQDEIDTKESGTVADDEVAAEMNNYMKHKENIFRNNHGTSSQPYFHVNGGPANLPTFHTVINRPQNKEDSPKWKKLFRYSSLENTISGFFNKRRSAKSSIATQHTLTDIPMNTSITSELGNMRRSSSMFSSVTKNMEEIGQNMIRHVRNLSLRRSRRGRDHNPLYVPEMFASGESTSTQIEDYEKPLHSSSHEVEGHGRVRLRATQSIEGNAIFNEAEAFSSKPTVLDNNNLLILSNPEFKDIEIPEKIIDAKQKRVMFESSSRAEQIFYAVDDHTDENLDEADKYSTDISSAESLPLDISRYDNVVPQNKQ
uniref:Rho-GAP domain-containing protein n=1 Tax=Panagrolaimus superbus TaxID=310955 RepID=A0A914YS10_9BILA